VQGTSCYQDMTKSYFFFYNLSFNNICLLIFSSNVFVVYLHIYFLDGLPLYGVYNSCVDYPYDDVVYYH